MSMQARLYAAVRGGDVHELRQLMSIRDEQGAKINPNLVVRRGVRGWTLLQWACFFRKICVVRYLVEEADVNIHGSTALHVACDVAGVDYAGALFATRAVRCLLPKVESVDATFLNRTFANGFPWDIKVMALEKYALGQGRSERFAEFPLHAVVDDDFPVPLRAEVIRDCVEHFPPSALFDNQGRCPLHCVLASIRTNKDANQSSTIATLLLDREPRAALVRDPKTGLFPFEAAASLSKSRQEDGDLGLVFALDETAGSYTTATASGQLLLQEVDCICRNDDGWLNFAYIAFRKDPERLLRVRGLPGQHQQSKEQDEP